MPLIYTKESLAQAGERLVTTFCVINGLVIPKFVYLSPESDLYRLNSCAYYRRNCISIMVPKCAHVGRGGRAWSWPGYVIDRTPYGVMAHECGHHVDLGLAKEEASRGAYFSDLGEKVAQESGEPPISGYCPNPAEWFAEVMRLFITNSDLLRCIRPRAYGLLSGFLNPVETRPWEEVLKEAPERTIAMAHKKIREKK